MALWRMKVRVLSTGRVSPYWVPGAPLPGPRVPFSPNAGRLLPELELVVVPPPLDGVGCEGAGVGATPA
jgi:hypothetical protein